MRFIPTFVKALASASVLSSVALPAAGRALVQHHEPRALLDVCAAIDLNAIVNLLPLGIDLGAIAGLDICLCLSALPLSITADVHLQALVNLLGLADVNALLNLLINTGPGSKHCTYPPGATPICQTNDPCGFQCPAPLTREGDQCVCAPPYSECNGKCGLFPKGCGSSSVPRSKRDLKMLLSARGGPTTLEEARDTCKAGESVCGTDAKPRWECINTEKNLESCGGCAVPNPFESAALQPRGVDCTSIPNVSSVQCTSGACQVLKCKTGFAVNKTNDGCEPSAPAPALVEQATKRHARRGGEGHAPHGDLLDIDVVAKVIADVL